MDKFLALCLAAILLISPALSFAQVKRDAETLVVLHTSAVITSGRGNTTGTGNYFVGSTVGRLNNFREAIFVLDVTGRVSASGNGADARDVMHMVLQTSVDGALCWENMARFSGVTSRTSVQRARWSSRVAPTTAAGACPAVGTMAQIGGDPLVQGNGVHDAIAINQGAAGQYWRVVAIISSSVANTAEFPRWGTQVLGYFRE